VQLRRAFSGLPAGCQASGTDYRHRGAKWYVTLGSLALLSTIVRRCNPVLPRQARIRDNLQVPISADPLSQGTEWPSQFRHRELVSISDRISGNGCVSSRRQRPPFLKEILVGQDYKTYEPFGCAKN